MIDETLKTLATERLRLMKNLSTVLVRRGGSYPDRAEQNKRMAARRKKYRAALRMNAAQMIAHIMLLWSTTSPEER